MPNNVLFLGHAQVSHAYDTFVDGCLNVFGKENVFECPCLEKYHADYRVSHTYHWWCSNDFGHTLSLTIEQWAQEINAGKIRYIVGSNRDMDSFMRLVALIQPQMLPNVCVVFLEEEEDPGFAIHHHCLERLKAIYNKIDIHYKVDYIAGRVGSYNKILPFYLSAPPNKIMAEVGSIKPFKDRQYDVCYLVSANHANRIAYYDILKQQLKIGNNIIECGLHKYSLKEYFNMINNSKIFISVRGNGWSNTRNVEGSFLGAALFTEKLLITVPFDYEDGKSAVFYDRNNLVSKLHEYLNDPNKLEQLAVASKEHADKNHTTTARAQQMIEQAKKIKGW